MAFAGYILPAAEHGPGLPGIGGRFVADNHISLTVGYTPVPAVFLNILKDALEVQVAPISLYSYEWDDGDLARGLEDPTSQQIGHKDQFSPEAASGSGNIHDMRWVVLVEGSLQILRPFTHLCQRTSAAVSPALQFKFFPLKTCT